MSQIHLLYTGDIHVPAVLMEESGVDHIRMGLHELLDDGSLSRLGVPELMKSLKEREPLEGTIATAPRSVGCRRRMV